jgi:hypothetical protein
LNPSPALAAMSGQKQHIVRLDVFADVILHDDSQSANADQFHILVNTGAAIALAQHFIHSLCQHGLRHLGFQHPQQDDDAVHPLLRRNQFLSLA